MTTKSLLTRLAVMTFCAAFALIAGVCGADLIANASDFTDIATDVRVLGRMLLALAGFAVVAMPVVAFVKAA